MNIKHLFLGAVAMGFMASCSSDGLFSDGGPMSGSFDSRGDGYVKLAINLPTTSSTGRNMPKKAIGDYGDNYGEFNDGDQNEYAVENVILCLFDDQNSTNEMEYKMISAYELSSGEWSQPDKTEIQITTHREFIKQISNGGAVGSLHAYVIINKHSFFSIDGNTLSFHSLRADKPASVVCNGMTLKEFTELSLKEAGRRYDANSFLMTNMPYVNVPGGASDPKNQGKTITINNLYPLKGAVYPTEAAAQAPDAKAAEINVERVLAKVETTLKSGIQQTEYKKYKFQFLGWFVDNTNPNTFVARNLWDNTAASGKEMDYLSVKNNKVNTWRMISQNPVSASQSDRFRTFWAIDANYNVRADEDGPDKLITYGGDVVDNRLMQYDAAGNNIGGRLRASGSHYYCTENTFDVEHQSVSNTTRIVVAAQFVGDDDQPKDFYTIDTEADLMYDAEGIEAYTKARIAGRSSFMVWAQDYLKAGDEENKVDATKYIKVKVTKPVTDEATPKATSGLCKVEILPITTDDLVGADLQVNTAEGKTAAVTAFNKLITSTDEQTGHNDYLAENFKMNFFNKGVSYYQALIQHYGEDETPWDKEAHAGMSNDVTHIYNNNNMDMYLGRYGIVRNNWYKIDVTGVRQIGSPVVPPVPGKDPLDPDDPDTPDDTVENYLKIKINIMPWAIRKQSVTL